MAAVTAAPVPAIEAELADTLEPGETILLMARPSPLLVPLGPLVSILWIAVLSLFLAWLDRRFGWPALRAHNRDLARWAHAILSDRFGVEPLSPRDGSWLGSLASVPLPRRLAASATPVDRIQAELSVRHDLEVPILDWRGHRLVRVSAHAYNRPEQYERLADALLSLDAEA